MHNIIIFGYKNLGAEIAKELQRRYLEFIVASNDIDDFKKAQKDGLSAYFLEDITDDKELISLGIGSNAKYIFCVCENESNNIFLTISARALDSKLKIIAEANSDDNKKKFELAGADKVIDPYEISANRIFNIIKKPQIVEILDKTIFLAESKNSINIVEIRVGIGSKLNNKDLESINLKSFNLLAIGIIDKEQSEEFIFLTGEYNPILDIDDTLIVVGKAEDIESFQKSIE